MKKLKYFGLPAILALLMLSSGCSKSKSYTELLNEEERATNWYLSGFRVENTIPADSVFETGENAPFYRMDDDGYLYMQVIDAGDMSKRPKTGDAVYMRYERYNIRTMFQNQSVDVAGNGNTGGSTFDPVPFLYGTYDTPQNLELGNGIQYPLIYLGYGCHVNLVLRSYLGFRGDQSQCIPYLVKVRYFKAEF